PELDVHLEGRRAPVDGVFALAALGRTLRHPGFEGRELLLLSGDSLLLRFHELSRVRGSALALGNFSLARFELRLELTCARVQQGFDGMFALPDLSLPRFKPGLELLLARLQLHVDASFSNREPRFERVEIAAPHQIA